MSVELGIFARIFSRRRAEDVAAAVAGAGFGLAQLNLSCIGLPTLPPVDRDVGLETIASAFAAERVRIWGLSATYNLVHPDLSVRKEGTERAKALIGRSGQVAVDFVTLCTGSRDPQDMWRHHPANGLEDAWRDMRAGLDQLLPAAERAGVRLGIEPEPGNVVADAARGRRLLEELGPDARLVGIILDPANLVAPGPADQDRALRAAFADLGEHTVALHAKDVVPGGYAAAGLGQLDYDLVFALHAGLPTSVPVIIQDALEADVPRTREFLLGCSATGPGRLPGRE
ncbi:MAG: sugar phosphate isomerase/epimerase family protein [Acidimicrobiales bacterium]